MLLNFISREETFAGRAAALLAVFVLQSFITFAQTDSTKKDLRFDLGITRDRNINLWPIFKRTFSSSETDKQILFPIYRSYQNLKLKEKRSHLLPLYWQDSSKEGKNFRMISTFYPSLYHTSINYAENTKTYTFLEFAPRINILEFKKSPDGLIMQNNLLFFLWYKNNQHSQKSHLVVFPVYWQFSSPRKENHTLLPIYSYGEYNKRAKKYFAITPLFWHFYSPKRSSSLLAPVWWSRTIIRQNDSIRSRLLLPIYFSHRSQFANNKVVFPVIWSLNNTGYKSLTIAPLLSVGQSTNTNRSHLMLTPLFWQFAREESKSTTLFPFIWIYKWQTRLDHYKSLVVFPIYWHRTDDTQKSNIVFPLLWSKATANYRSFTLLPLLSVGKSPDKSLSHVAITPLFWQFKTPEKKTNALLPVWYYSKKTDENSNRTNNIIFPLYWGWQRDSQQGNVFFPIMWRLKSTNYLLFSIFPIFSYGKSNDGRSGYTAITPIYWRFKTTEGKGQLLFPFWWERNKTQEGQIKNVSQVILFYWKYKDSERKHQGLFPLAWRFKNQNRSSFTIFPLLSIGQRDNNERKYLSVTPIFWQFKNQHRTFSTLIPVWWSKTDFTSKNVKHFKLLIPVYFLQRDTIKTRRVIFPLAWRFKNPHYRSFTLVPIFSQGQNSDKTIIHRTISPLFWYFKNPSGYTSALLPFFWRSKYGEGKLSSERTILFPIYFYTNNSDNQNRIVFPVIWDLNNGDYKSLTIIPLFSFGRNDDNTQNHFAITPLFYSIKKQNYTSKVLFPIWWSIRDKNRQGTKSKDILFPIYWSFQNQHRSVKVLFPIVWNIRSAKSKSTTVIPVFSKGISRNGIEHLAVTPIYWMFKTAQMTRTLLLPAYSLYNDRAGNRKFNILFFLFRNSKMDGDTSMRIVWPIIEHSKNADYRYFRFAPLIWSKQGRHFSYFTIQPFFYKNKSESQTTSRLLWELYVHRNVYGTKKSNRILWKFVEWEKHSNGDKEFRVLHLLYANSKINGKVEKSLFPLYYITKDSNGNKSLSVMLYFYNSMKRNIPNTTEFYQEERIFWLIRIRSNYRILKEKGIELD